MTMLATVAAVANIPSIYFRVAQDYDINGIKLLAKVILPAILPQIISAIRVTAGVAWLVVVAAEMVSGRDGLGFAIWDARNGLRIEYLTGRTPLSAASAPRFDGPAPGTELVPRMASGRSSAPNADRPRAA